MRILIHTDEYFPTCAACAYRMKSFADTFVNCGHTVTVIASSTNRGNGTAASVRERVIFAPTIRMRKKTALMRLVNNISFAVTSVLASFAAGSADIVITTSPPPLVSLSGWLIAKLKRARLVYDVRDIWPDVALEMESFMEGSMYCRIFRWITNFMYRHADMVTTVSPGKVAKIQSKLPANESSKVELVGNGFDETILKSQQYREVIEKFQLGSRFTCVYIGNIGLAQGLDCVLDLAKKTHDLDVQFLLFGDGAERDILTAKVQEQGLENIRFCGPVPHEHVFTILSNAQLSLIPLKSAHMKDSIPTKLYESLGVGCPALLVAEGDACRIVEETGFGRCVSPDDPVGLYHAFRSIVKEYEEIRMKRTAAADWICNRYSRQTIATVFEKRLCDWLKG